MEIDFSCPLREECCQECGKPLKEGDIFYKFGIYNPYYCPKCAMILSTSSDYNNIVPTMFLLHEHIGRYCINACDISELESGIYITKRVSGKEIIMERFHMHPLKTVVSHYTSQSMKVYELHKEGGAVYLPYNQYINVQDFLNSPITYESLGIELLHNSFGCECDIILNTDHKIIGFITPINYHSAGDFFDLITDDMYTMSQSELQEMFGN